MTEATTARKRLGIVTPVHNEAENLARYEQEVRRVLLSCGDVEVSVLLVDDGSQDQSWEMIEEICGRDGRFRGVRLSRNFGAHAALCAALHHAEGDAVAILACDLQDPPETVLEFVKKWREGAQIVWGRRLGRADQRWRSWASRFFENLIRRFAMPAGSRFTTGSFLLMDRRVLECYRQFRETNRITFALVAWTGFKQTVVDYDRRARQAGKSSWNLKKLVRAAYDTFLAYSAVPFGVVTAVGVSLFLISIMLSIYLLHCYVTGNPRPGWVSTMLTFNLFFGIHFIIMSVQGEYLSRIYSEAVGRPLYFVSETTRGNERRNCDAA